MDSNAGHNVLIFSYFTYKTMSTKSQAAFLSTWEQLRRHATDLGIPAWRLAEDLGWHEINSKVDTGESAKVGSGGLSLDAGRQ